MNKLQAPSGGASSDASAGGFESWLSVVRAYALCEKALTARLAPLGLSIAQHDILANVARDPGLTQSVLAGRMLVTRSNVSMLLTQMEKLDLVQRRPSPNDARANHLHLTRAGAALVQRSLAEQATVVRLMLGQASKNEQKTIQSVMQRIVLALQAELSISGV
jgi:DNA-binding MarR family transcriptional regulator